MLLLQLLAIATTANSLPTNLRAHTEKVLPKWIDDEPIQKNAPAQDGISLWSMEMPDNKQDSNDLENDWTKSPVQSKWSTDMEDETFADSKWSMDKEDESPIQSKWSMDVEEKEAIKPKWSMDVEDETPVESKWSIDYKDEETAKPKWSIDYKNEEVVKPKWSIDYKDEKKDNIKYSKALAAEPKYSIEYVDADVIAPKKSTSWMPKFISNLFVGSEIKETVKQSTENVASTVSASEDVTNWLAEETKGHSGIAYNQLLSNIHPAGTARGIIIASPSNIRNSTDNNYFFHWKRDSALVMDVLNTFYSGGLIELEHYFWDYANLSKELMTLRTETGMGEPKFRVDASPFSDPWCRPQNDGPGLEASTLIRFVSSYLADGGDLEKVKSLLYDSKLPTNSVIKANLEYVANNWQSVHTCDLWEEQRGDFFYTRMAQRRSLIEGAAIASEMGDKGAGQYYASQAAAISVALDKHWDSNRGYIISGFGEDGNVLRSGLDIANILAVIQTDRGDDISFSVVDDRVLATLKPIVDSFKQIYQINKVNADASGLPIGIAVGRYKEDTYDGVENNGGNPWYLATSAVAEYLYKVSIAWKTKGFIPVTQRNLAFFKEFLGVSQAVSGAVYSKGDELYDQIHMRLMTIGDSYIRRIMYHSKNGRLPEEFNKENGNERGSKDLTWSYAAIITAGNARQKLMNMS